MAAFTTHDRFARLEQSHRDRLDSVSKLDEFLPGAEILAAGRPSDSLLLIAAGAVEIRVKTRAGEVTLAELSPGDLMGEIETFADLPEGLRHVARVDTIVRAVAKDPLKQELRAHRSFATELLFVYSRSISEKIRAANQVASRLVSGSVAMTPGGERAPHLSEEDANWLAVMGERVEYPAGATVVAEGEATRSFYVVEQGEVDVRKHAHGGDRSLARLGNRDLFGIMAFVDGKPRSASVVTTGACAFTRIEPDALERALEMNFTVSFKFLGTLCGVLGRTFVDTVRQVVAASA